MKTTLLSIALFAASSAAFATNNNPPVDPPTTTTTATSSAGAVAGAGAIAGAAVGDTSASANGNSIGFQNLSNGGVRVHAPSGTGDLSSVSSGGGGGGGGVGIGGAGGSSKSVSGVEHSGNAMIKFHSYQMDLRRVQHREGGDCNKNSYDAAGAKEHKIVGVAITTQDKDCVAIRNAQALLATYGPLIGLNWSIEVMCGRKAFREADDRADKLCFVNGNGKMGKEEAETEKAAIENPFYTEQYAQTDK